MVIKNHYRTEPSVRESNTPLTGFFLTKYNYELVVNLNILGIKVKSQSGRLDLVNINWIIFIVKIVPTAFLDTFDVFICHMLASILSTVYIHTVVRCHVVSRVSRVRCASASRQRVSRVDSSACARFLSRTR